MKVQGLAKSKLFEHFVNNTSISYQKLFRFMFMSTSHASVARQFFHELNIYHSGDEFSISYNRSNFQRQHWQIPYDVLICILKFLNPQRLKLSVNFIFNLELLAGVLPYLTGVNKLAIEVADRALISCLQGLLPQLDEIECRTDVLTLPNFPILTLKKLTILDILHYNLPLSILRHDIKTFCFYCDQDKSNQKMYINESNKGQASIEKLILRLDDVFSTQHILSLVTNYCKYLPKLKNVSLELSISGSDENNESFASRFIAALNEIVSFKNNVKDLLLELTVNVFILNRVYTNKDWEIVLSKAAQFNHVSVKKDADKEILKSRHCETIDTMSFKLNFELIRLVYLDEAIQPITYNHNWNIDESNIDYDYYYSEDGMISE